MKAKPIIAEVPPLASNSPTPAAEPLFESFSRYPEQVDDALLPGGAVRRFAESVSDIAGGVETVLALAIDDGDRESRRVNSDEMSEDDRPLLSANQLWNLQRLALASMKRLQIESEDLMLWAFDRKRAGR